jgi:GTPase SAR1 family protein
MDQPPTRISITICGDGGTGKSSITLRLVRSQWTSTYDPTIEDSYSITRRIDGHVYHLALTDTAGQEEYRGMWAGKVGEVDAFLLVYDITSASSLEQLAWFADVVDIESEGRAERAVAAAAAAAGKAGRRKGAASKAAGLESVVLPVKIVAGNKCDLADKREVDAKTGLEWARSRGCGFMETSARNVVNIEETFALIVRRVMERRRAAEEAMKGQGQGKEKEGGMRVESAVTTRHAVTAPLSPLPVDEKGGGGELRRGLSGPQGQLTFWNKLRCW